MRSSKKRSQEQIFKELFHQLRVHNREVSESPDRLDPVMKLLLQSFSYSLAKSDARLQQTWDQARASLIQAVCPGPGRWPVPAHTVMRCVPVDDIINVDTSTRFYYKEEREGGSTFFFAPVVTSRVLKASTRHVFLSSETGVFDLSPYNEKGESVGKLARNPVRGSDRWVAHIAVQFSGPPSALDSAGLYIHAGAEAQRNLHWGNWYFSYLDDPSVLMPPFCPGRADNIERKLGIEGQAFDWGGFRDAITIFQDLNTGFVRLPEKNATSWKTSPIAASLTRRCSDQGLRVPPSNEEFYWIRVELPQNCDPSCFDRPVEFCFDAILANNRAEFTLLRHTGGRRLFEIEIPVDIPKILEIVSVTDSVGNDYRPAHTVSYDRQVRPYSLEERDDRLSVWIDLSDSLDVLPDRASLVYSTTDGPKANGIEAGKITSLYQSHPGLQEVHNLTSVTGGMPAKSDEQLVREASVRLRQRDRALTFVDIADWCVTFDPRIRTAECSNAIERIDGKVLRCIKVRINVNSENFSGENELVELKCRLEVFLKSRSAVNSRYLVEIAGE